MSHPPVSQEFRQLAKTLRACGSDQIAKVWEIAADLLDKETKKYDEESLDLDQAARESGFSRDHLFRLMHDGKLKNVGEPRSPRIQRQDLPRKPGYRPPPPDPDPIGEALDSHGA